MAEMIDVLGDDAFRFTDMSAAILRLDPVPGELGALRLFTPAPIRTDNVTIEVQFADILH